MPWFDVHGIHYMITEYFLFLFQKLYGRLGMKPDKHLIKAYESYTLGNCGNFKLSTILQVTVTRCSAK